MCLPKSHPNYYRCDWRDMAADMFFDNLVAAAADVGVSLAVGVIDDEHEQAFDEIAGHARGLIRDAVVEELGPEASGTDYNRAAAEFERHERGGRRGTHLLCAVAAAVGEACAELTTVPADLAAEVGQVVRRQTNSARAGRLATAATATLLEDVVTSLDPVTQVRYLADLAAIGVCPAQQEGGVPTHHPQVQLCLDRVNRTITNEVVDGLLTPTAVDA